MGGQQSKEAIEAILKGDIRTAADLALAYYDKSYSRKQGVNSNKVIAFAADNNDMEGSAERMMGLVIND
jgi:hypothetical protein